MFAVIFRAQINKLDSEYSTLAEELRALALKEYGCVEFVSTTDDTNEIAISYWNSEQEILHWKQASEHLIAQKLGKQKWYASYRVEVTKISRSYTSNNV